LAQYLGLDGCRGGWAATWIDDQGNHGINYSSSLGRLLAITQQRAMIDMPIGLKMSGHRKCDIAAREHGGMVTRSCSAPHTGADSFSVAQSSWLYLDTRHRSQT
jgi:predicted RNase H-like nuclease